MGFESSTSHSPVSAMPTSAFFCPLHHEGVLSVQGPDAAKFLQGQLTCNLDYLDAAHSSLGARCTPKGRMISTFRIVPHAQGYLLAMASDLIEAQLTDLKKYAVFFKVQLHDASAEWVRYGIHGAAESALPTSLVPPAEAGSLQADDGALAIRLDDARIELWVPKAQADSAHARLRAAIEEQPLSTWLLQQIRAGVGQVFGATRELFIPQMINLQALGGVSFRKGCYAGQEIVARMQYLGKLKRRMYRLALQGTVPVPGTELFSPVHSSSVGEVVLSAPTEDGCELLAVVQEDALADGRLSLAPAADTTLTLLDLPYQLDRDREIQR